MLPFFYITIRSNQMFFFFIFYQFLPALNRNDCNSANNGYTCSQLNDGIEYVKTHLLNKTRTKNITIISNSNTEADIIFTRFATLCFALATDSNPVFLPQSNQRFYPNIATFGPHIGYQENVYQPIETCKIIKTLPNTTNIYTINLTATSILFSPTLNVLFDKIGPAALHILIHLTLNYTDPLGNRTNYAVFQGQLPPSKSCEIYNGLSISDKCDFKTMIEASRSSTFICPYASIQGWLITLLRGTSPVLYDKVGNGCWKAKSYLAGGINLIYPGIERSILDLARSNLECPNTTLTKQYLPILL